MSCHMVVDEQESVDLLLYAPRVLRAHDEFGGALVGLDLVQRGLDLTALGVESCEVAGRRRLGVHDVVISRWTVTSPHGGVLDHSGPRRF